jgi:hypothetical protein
MAPPRVRIPENACIQRSRRTSTSGRRAAACALLIGGITNALFSIFNRGAHISTSNPTANIAQRHNASLFSRALLPDRAFLGLFALGLFTPFPFVHIVKVTAKALQKTEMKDGCPISRFFCEKWAFVLPAFYTIAGGDFYFLSTVRPTECVGFSFGITKQ